MAEAPRSPEQRRRDTLHRLEHDVDAWVSTADPGTGTPHLIPLSFLWDGSTILIATPDEARPAATSRRPAGFGSVWA